MLGFSKWLNTSRAFCHSLPQALMVELNVTKLRWIRKVSRLQNSCRANSHCAALPQAPANWWSAHWLRFSRLQVPKDLNCIQGVTPGIPFHPCILEVNNSEPAMPKKLKSTVCQDSSTTTIKSTKHPWSTDRGTDDWIVGDHVALTAVLVHFHQQLHCPLPLLRTRGQCCIEGQHVQLLRLRSVVMKSQPPLRGLATCRDCSVAGDQRCFHTWLSDALVDG